MSGWEAAAKGYLDELARKPAARAPATLGEIWNSEWGAASLDTLGGSGQPMQDAYTELVTRTSEVTGRNLGDLAAERGLALDGRGFDGRIDSIGKIIDSLPDGQQKLLADYKDVRGRARARAAETLKDAEDVRSASYGLSAMATGFAAQAARQMVDPVNLALAPIGGPAKGPVLKWLGREFAIGAGAQIVQEPGIRFRREELGLESSSLENILTAGIGQAGFAGLFRLAGAGVERAIGRERRFGMDLAAMAESADPDLARQAFFDTVRRDAVRGSRLEDIPTADQQAQMRMDAGAPQTAPRNRAPGLTAEETAQLQGLSAADFAAIARHAEGEALTDMMAGSTPAQAGRFQDAARFLNEGGALPQDPAAASSPALRLDGVQRMSRTDGSSLGVRYAVVDRADIQTSHDALGNLNPNYPQALQPRDRSRGVSADWINGTAARLDPDQLIWSPVSDYGAPVIGPDGLVESGNGRVLAIETAYRRHPEVSGKYRQRIEELGFDTEGMAEPVLVRIRTDELAPEERVKLAIEGNKPSVAGLSSTERAFADARMLDDPAMQLWMGGAVSDARNAPFVRSFIDRALSPAERNAAIDAGGRLSQDGERRIEAALVAKAWANRNVVKALTEATDDEARNILGAMADVSPQVASLKAAIADGRVPAEIDPAPAVLLAYELVAMSRRNGRPVREYLDQIDLVRGAVPADVEAALRLFYADDAFTQPASRKRVVERLDHAVSRAIMHQGGGFFGETADAGQFLRAARYAGENLSNIDLAKAMAAAASETPAPKMTLDDVYAQAPAADARMKAAGAEIATTPADADAIAAALAKRFPKVEGLQDSVEAMLARLTATLADAPPDMMLALPRADGTLELLPAGEHVKKLAAERKAVDELNDCIIRAGGTLEDAL